MGVFASKSERQTSEPRKISIIYTELLSDDDLFLDSLMKKIEKHLLKKSNWKIVENKKLECYYKIEYCDYVKLKEFKYLQAKFFDRLKKFIPSIEAEMIYPKTIANDIEFCLFDGKRHYGSAECCKFQYIGE